MRRGFCRGLETDLVPQSDLVRSACVRIVGIQLRFRSGVSQNACLNKTQFLVEDIIRVLHLRVHLLRNARTGIIREGIVEEAAHTFHSAHVGTAQLVQIITKRPQRLADLFYLLLLELRIRCLLARIIREFIIRLDTGRRQTAKGHGFIRKGSEFGDLGSYVVNLLLGKVLRIIQIILAQLNQRIETLFANKKLTSLLG